jgi:hypothetical protein
MTNMLFSFDPASLAWRIVDAGSGFSAWVPTEDEGPGPPRLARAGLAAAENAGGLYVFGGQRPSFISGSLQKRALHPPTYAQGCISSISSLVFLFCKIPFYWSSWWPMA